MGELRATPYLFDRNDQVLSLLNRVFKPWMGDEKYFDWKYSKLQTDGCDFPRGWVIEKDGKIVAFNGYVPRRIWNGSEHVWVLQSFDTATDPDCRGAGLFSILQEEVYAEMEKANIRWVYGWTSEIGFKVFTAKVDWKIWGEQKYLIKVFNTKPFVENKVGNGLARLASRAGLYLYGHLRKSSKAHGIVVKQESNFPQNVGKMSEELYKQYRVAAARDDHYLQWRYSNPMQRYRLLCAYSGDYPLGYMVLADRDEAIDIEDFMAATPDSLSTLLSQVEILARSESKNLVRFRVNVKHPRQDVFKKSGYFWSKTSFPMLGRFIINDGSIPLLSDHLHWTVFDRNE